MATPNREKLKEKEEATDENVTKSFWTHWYRTFAGYIQKYDDLSNGNKLALLINHVDSAAYEVILESRSFEEAINELQKVYPCLFC